MYVVSLTASFGKLQVFELGHGRRGCSVSANAAFDARDGESRCTILYGFTRSGDRGFKKLCRRPKGAEVLHRVAMTSRKTPLVGRFAVMDPLEEFNMYLRLVENRIQNGQCI